MICISQWNMQTIMISVQTHIIGDYSAPYNPYVNVGKIAIFKKFNCSIVRFFGVYTDRFMSRRETRASFEHVFDFDRDRIVADTDCGLLFQ